MTEFVLMCTYRYKTDNINYTASFWVNFKSILTLLILLSQNL